MKISPDGTIETTNAEEAQMILDRMGYGRAKPAESLEVVIEEDFEKVNDFVVNALEEPVSVPLPEKIVMPVDKAMPMHAEDFRIGIGVYRASNGQLFIPHTRNEIPIINVLRKAWQDREGPLTSRQIAHRIGMIEEKTVKTVMYAVSSLAREERGVERLVHSNRYQLSRAGRQGSWQCVGKPQVALRTWRADGMKEQQRKAVSA